MPAVLAEHSAWVVRYALGSVQYRSMLEWSDQTLAEAQSAYDRVANFIERAGAAVGEQPSREEIMAISADALPADFVAAMNDDINVSGASAAIFTAIRFGNTLLSKLADRADSDVAKAEVREALVNVRAMLDTLGLDPLAPEPIPPSMTRSTSWFPNSLRNVPKRARPRISHVPTRSVTRWARPASPSRTVRKAPLGR